MLCFPTILDILPPLHLYKYLNPTVIEFDVYNLYYAFIINCINQMSYISVSLLF